MTTLTSDGVEEQNSVQFDCDAGTNQDHDVRPRDDQAVSPSLMLQIKFTQCQFSAVLRIDMIMMSLNGYLVQT